MLSRRRRSEGGFSLVEMMVAIAILGVITVPLANVVMGMIRHTSESSSKLNESHDAQIAAAYWSQDVADLGTRSTDDPMDPQLLRSVETDVDAGDGTYQCGGEHAVVRLASDNVVASGGSASTTLVKVVYVVRALDGRYALHRLRCVGSTTPVSDITLAKNLFAAPQVVCDSACGGSGSDVPRTVQLRMRIQDPHSTSSYDVTLTGQRRQE